MRVYVHVHVRVLARVRVHVHVLPEGSGGRECTIKVRKCVGPSAPHIFLTFMAQSRPPNRLRTQFLDFTIVSESASS